MSVQYRGADTPSEKAEFSHQDCAIMLTIVAYYDHGLNRKQLCDTFAVLDKKGKNAKAVIYDEWVKLSKLQMIDLDSEAVNSINKIDLANNAQFEVLFKYFNKSIGTINLWLNSCVFPDEVDMYPKRLVANSWHVSHYTPGNQRCVGFSGTNDNHQILPLHIKQSLPWDTDDEVWSNLLSTNGRMLDMIIEKTLACVELEKGKSNATLLQYIKAVSKDPVIRIDALIDSGALLAGQSNAEVARFIMKECLCQKDTKLKGVRNSE